MKIKKYLSKKISKIIVFGNGSIHNLLTQLFRYLIKNKRSISNSDEIIGYLNYKSITCKLYLDRKSYIDKKIIKDRIHSRYILDEISNNIKPNSVFIDVGANIGSISIPIAIYFQNKNLKVIACEASTLMYQKLLKNINLNSLQNIDSINLAIYKNNNGVTFYEQTESNKNHGLSGTNKNFDIGDYVKKKIHSITIDQIINSKKIKENVSVIKIDTQGGELDVLYGAIETIKRDQPVVIFEHEDDYHQDSKSIKSKILYFFKKNNYQLFLLSPTIENFLIPIDLDGYVNSNIIAIPIFNN